jgi:hypothetical protein
MNEELNKRQARKGRMIALVIAAGGIVAILAPWLVRVLELPFSYEILFYLGALASFVWALVNIYQLWRSRQD